MMAVKRCPLLIAHRGDPAHSTENTLTSFHQAIAKGAKALEADVRLSSDGTWVVFHDRSLRRTTGRSGWIAKTSWTVLSSFGILQLEDLLDFCQRRKVQLFLDVKVSGKEERLARALKRGRFRKSVSLGAGSIPALALLRRALKGVPLFWVTGYRVSMTQGRISQAKGLGLKGLVAYKRWVTRSVLRKVHQAGLKLYAWTIRTPRELERYARLGVDGIMSEVWPPPHVP